MDILNNPSMGIVKYEITANDLKAVIVEAVQQAKDAFSLELKAESKDELVPRKEAMEILNVRTVLTMLRWEKKGYLHPHRIASRIFYKRSELMKGVKGFERLED